MSARISEVLSFLDSHPIPLEGVKLNNLRISDLPGGRYSREIAEKIETIDFGDHVSRDLADVTKGLLYFAVGGVDETHALVTPYSSSSSAAFAEPPVLNSPWKKDATYVHAMVHRREGPYKGEFGSGWSNSGYWFSAVGPHPIYEKVYEAANQLAGNNAILKKHMGSHGGAWKPSQFLSLCESAEGKREDEPTIQFCKDVINAEWRILFDNCYSAIT